MNHAERLRNIAAQIGQPDYSLVELREDLLVLADELNAATQDAKSPDAEVNLPAAAAPNFQNTSRLSGKHAPACQNYTQTMDNDRCFNCGHTMGAHSYIP